MEQTGEGPSGKRGSTVDYSDDDLCEDCLIMHHSDGFGKNLLRNGFGSPDKLHECTFVCSTKNWRCTQYVRTCSDENCPKFKFWNITDSGGDGWEVEKLPVGCDPLLQEVHGGTSCFVTSYGLCSKEQLIKLSEHGLTDRIMDEVRPHMQIGEWYAGRFDCDAKYCMKVSLLDEEMNHLYTHGMCKILSAGNSTQWSMAMYTFRDYGPGVRYVMFAHTGQDTQYWKGHYGSKMAGGHVIARLPRLRFKKRRKDGKEENPDIEQDDGSADSELEDSKPDTPA